MTAVCKHQHTEWETELSYKAARCACVAFVITGSWSQAEREQAGRVAGRYGWSAPDHHLLEGACVHLALMQSSDAEGLQPQSLHHGI